MVYIDVLKKYTKSSAIQFKLKLQLWVLAPEFQFSAYNIFNFMKNLQDKN